MAARNTHIPLILGSATVLGLGVMALGGSGAVSEIIDDGLAWAHGIIDRVSRHEGGFDALNLNSDGAGLSFGMLQWAQEPGSLGVLLQAMYRADPARFQATFGPAHRELVKVTLQGSLAPVGGALLWKQPWVDRFTQAGRDPVFQAVQRRLAVDGPYFKAALECSRILGIRTERSLALFMDAAVQQGAGFATRLAAKVARVHPPTAGDLATLRVFAEQCGAPFIRRTPPEGPHAKAPRLQWHQVGPSEWHVRAGAFDLYTNVMKRRMGIVEDRSLSDTPIRLAEV